MSHETEHRTDSITYTPSTDETRQTVFPEKVRRLDRLNRGGQWAIGGVIASLAIAGGFLGGKALSEKNEAPNSVPKPTAEAPVTPGPIESEAPVETTEPSPAETEPSTSNELQPIPADLSVEELAKASSNLYLDWVLANATDETVEEAYDKWHTTSDISVEEFTHNVAQLNADRYSSVLFSNTWSENPDLVEYYDNTLNSNATLIEVALQRHVAGEPLVKISTSISNITELDAPEGQRIIRYDIDGEYENSDQEYIDGTVIETFDISDGTARLIQIDSITA